MGDQTKGMAFQPETVPASVVLTMERLRHGLMPTHSTIPYVGLAFHEHKRDGAFGG